MSCFESEDFSPHQAPLPRPPPPPRGGRGRVNGVGPPFNGVGPPFNGVGHILTGAGHMGSGITLLACSARSSSDGPKQRGVGARGKALSLLAPLAHQAMAPNSGVLGCAVKRSPRSLRSLVLACSARSSSDGSKQRGVRGARQSALLAHSARSSSDGPKQRGVWVRVKRPPRSLRSLKAAIKRRFFLPGKQRKSAGKKWKFGIFPKTTSPEKSPALRGIFLLVLVTFSLRIPGKHTPTFPPALRGRKAKKRESSQNGVRRKAKQNEKSETFFCSLARLSSDGPQQRGVGVRGQSALLARSAHSSRDHTAQSVRARTRPWFPIDTTQSSPVLPSPLVGWPASGRATSPTVQYSMYISPQCI
eukprot:gene7754-biopygen22564